MVVLNLMAITLVVNIFIHHGSAMFNNEDAIKKCKDILAETLPHGVDNALQNLKTWYVSNTKNQLRDKYKKPEGVEERRLEVERELKISVTLRYLKIFFTGRGLAKALRDGLPPTKWCLEVAKTVSVPAPNTESGQSSEPAASDLSSEPTPSSAPVASSEPVQSSDSAPSTECHGYFLLLNMNVEYTTIYKSFKIFFMNWTAETLNYDEIIKKSNREEEPLETIKSKSKIFDVYIVSYYNYIKGLIDNLTISSDLNLMNVEDFCKDDGKTVVLDLIYKKLGETENQNSIL